MHPTPRANIALKNVWAADLELVWDVLAKLLQVINVYVKKVLFL